MQAMESDITLIPEGNEFHWYKEYANVAKGYCQKNCAKCFLLVVVDASKGDVSSPSNTSVISLSIAYINHHQ